MARAFWRVAALSTGTLIAAAAGAAETSATERAYGIATRKALTCARSYALDHLSEHTSSDVLARMAYASCETEFMARILFYLDNAEGDVKPDRFQVMRDASREKIVPMIRAFVARQRQ